MDAQVDASEEGAGRLTEVMLDVRRGGNTRDAVAVAGETGCHHDDDSDSDDDDNDDDDDGVCCCASSGLMPWNGNECCFAKASSSAASSAWYVNCNSIGARIMDSTV